MAAHLRLIRIRTCIRCGKRATKTLYNTRNAEISDYCKAHAQPALVEFKKMEGERV